MGLDTHLYYIKKNSELEEIYKNLADEENKHHTILYWRKHHALTDWFGTEIGEHDNCERYELTKEDLQKFLFAIKNRQIDYEYHDREKDIVVLDKFIEDMDFNKIKVFIYNWW